MTRGRTAAATALIFGIVGPAAATLAFGLWGLVQAEGPADAGASVLGLLWLLPFGYMFGAVPAAVTGAAVGALAHRRPPVLFAVLGAVIGGLLMAAIGIFDAETPALTEGVFVLALIGALAGGLSGGVCWLRARRTRS